VTHQPGGPSTYYHGPARGTPNAPHLRREARPLGPQVLEFFAIILLMLMAYNGVIWLWNRTSPKEVNIPRVVGFKQDEALAVLKSADLQAEVTAEKYDEKMPEGAVLAADPAPGRLVKAGRVVRLTLSLGSRWSKVPDVQKMSVDRARALIRTAKLAVGRESAKYHPAMPIGYVITQQPAPNTRRPRNSEIALIVSRGPEPREGGEEGATLPATTGKRSYDVEFVIPPGPSLQEVRIVVTDQNGEHEVYRGSHQVGETVRKRVRGEGPEVMVQIFDSGFLAEQHTF